MRSLLCLRRVLVPSILAICSMVSAQQPPPGWSFDANAQILTDDDTGTMWSSPVCDRSRFPPCYDRDQALAYAAALTLGVFTDWRLSSKKELEKACADGIQAAISYYFPNADWNGASVLSGSTQGKKYPWLVDLGSCGSVAVGAGSTDAIICSRGFEYTGRGGGKKGGGNKLTGSGSSTERYGIATSGCQGVPSIDSKGEPQAGARVFAITCGNAPRRATGILMLSYARASVMVPALRLHLLVDPSFLVVSHVVQADAKGGHATVLPLPTGSRGAEFFGQFLWLDPACSMQPLSASTGLAVRVR
jgi:hypothetical protein